MSRTNLRSYRVVATIGAILVMVSCTAHGAGHAANSDSAMRTSTAPGSAQPRTSPSLPATVPFTLAAVDVPPRPPWQPLPAGEADGSCPYIKAGLNIEPDPSGGDFADLEGNRVQRVTLLTTLRPIGCRFYFENDYHPVGDILPMTYPSAVAAHNAMVATAEVGSSAQGEPSFVPGVDGVSFRTAFSSPDAGEDWAFAFAKANFLVVVRTDQNRNLPANAMNIAKAIVARF